MSTHRILLGGEYLHAPTGQRVVVLEHELRFARRSPQQSARTGNFIVRSAHSCNLTVVPPDELQQLP